MSSNSNFKLVLFAALAFVAPNLVCAAEASEEEGVSWYAHVNRGFLSVNDGHERHTYFVDSTYDNSTIGIIGETKLNSDMKLGGQLESWMLPASSNDPAATVVSQLNRSGSTHNIKINVVDTWLDTKAGKLSLGRGIMASKSTGNVSLSGTDLIVTAFPADMAGGMFFHPKDAARRVIDTDPRIGSDTNAFGAISGIGDFHDRVRYDFPKFGDFLLATSFATESGTDANNLVNRNKYVGDVGLHYKKEFTNFTAQAGAAFVRYSKDSDEQTQKFYNGSFALLHKSTGLNAAFSLGKQKNQIIALPATLNQDRKFYYVQLGKQADLVHYGKTNFAIDYFQSKNSIRDEDKGKAYSVGVQQELTKINSAVYFGVRQYKYNTPAQAYDKILAAFLGIKVRFEGKLPTNKYCD